MADILVIPWTPCDTLKLNKPVKFYGWFYMVFPSLNGEMIRERQAMLTNEVGKHVVKGQKYALLHFPNHQNVGDSAIWLGAIRLLYGITGHYPEIVSAQPTDISHLQQKIGTGVPIFLLGGGNLGDIWLEHQQFRERVIVGFPKNRIIQLPQSIHFSAESASDPFARKIEAHGNFHLMVRDRQSLDFAQRKFNCPVALMPDTAMCLGQLKRLAVPQVDETLFMLRTDKEKAPLDMVHLQKVLGNLPVWDWLTEPPELRKRMKPRAILDTVMSGTLSRETYKERLFRRMAENRLQRGMRMLSSAERIITDRLHVHILSVLMDIPHVAADNNYGKIHGYLDQWTASSPLVVKAVSAEEVLDGLARLPYLTKDGWQNVNKPIQAQAV